MRTWRSGKKGISFGLAAVMTLAACISSQASVEAAPPAYLRSATYVSDAWVINFWNTESDHMDAELAQIAADGFNSIILVIPWREFQPGLNPVSYNSYAFEKLDKVMAAAEKQGLWVRLRVSYTWDYYGGEELLPRFKNIVGDARTRQVWLDYVKTVYQAASAHPNFHGGFITWEDFWNYVEEASGFGTTLRSQSEAKRIGYQDYLKNHYTLEEISEYYGRQTPFTSCEEVYIPQRELPAYRLFYEFYDEFLMRLLQDAQQVFPDISMEVRLDADPVQGLDEKTVGVHHFKTFSCGNSGYTSLMYSVSMGQGGQGQVIKADAALAAADSQLHIVKAYNGGKPIYIDQLLYTDATEEFAGNTRLEDNARGEFLVGMPGILRKYTNGYGIWSYRNYTNNPLYNSQFALENRGWSVSRSRAAERGGSMQMKMESGGKVSQAFGSRLTGQNTHDNHVRFTADSDKPTTLLVSLGGVTKVIYINGRKQFDLNFGKLGSYREVAFESRGELYLDNVQVYNFIQDGQLYDIDGGELSCIGPVRTLNRSMGAVRY